MIYVISLKLTSAYLFSSKFPVLRIMSKCFKLNKALHPICHNIHKDALQNRLEIKMEDATEI